MIIQSVSSIQNQKPYVDRALSFSAKNIKSKKDVDYFKKCSAKKLPEGKAIEIGLKTSTSAKILNAIGLILSLAAANGGCPFVWLYKDLDQLDLKLVDIDKNNLTKKQKKLIRKGLLIDFIPRGYEIKDGKVLKMEK